MTAVSVAALPSQPAAPVRTPSGASRRWGPTAGVIVVYLVAAWAVLLPLGLASSGRLPVMTSEDVGQQTWLLALWLHQLASGHLSFFTSLIDGPSGINLLDSASMPLLGVLMAPVTALVGPVGSFLVLLRLAHFVSALAMYFVLRRLDRSTLAAALGGLLYGFAPYMGPPTAIHAFVLFVPLPPLMLLIVWQQLSQPDAKRPLRAGMVLGLLAVLQFLICSEVLVTVTFVGALTLGVLAVWAAYRRRSLRARLDAGWRLAAGILAVAVPLLAYPVSIALAGRAHVSGPTQAPGQRGVDILNIVVPNWTRPGKFGGDLLASLWHAGTATIATWPAENLAYLGPLLIVGVVVVARGPRDQLTRTVAVLAAIGWVLALGPRLIVDGHTSGVRLPFALAYHVPILQDISPSRLVLYVFLGASVLVATAVDRLRALRWQQACIGLAGVGVCLALAAPATGLHTAQTGYSSGAVNAVRKIPARSVALAYPYPRFSDETMMLLQAEAGMRFSVLGGYANRASPPNGNSTKSALMTAPAPLSRLLTGGFDQPRLNRDQRRELMLARAELPVYLRDAGVTAVVIQQSDRAGRRLAAIVAAALGPAPVRHSDLLVWPAVKA